MQNFKSSKTFMQNSFIWLYAVTKEYIIGTDIVDYRACKQMEAKCSEILQYAIYTGPAILIN